MTTPSPKPVTDSMNGVRPKTSNRIAGTRSPPEPIRSSHPAMWSLLPVADRAVANRTPPRRIRATSSTVGPSCATAVRTSSSSGRKAVTAPSSAATSPAAPAVREGTRSASRTRTTTTGATATPVIRSSLIATNLPGRVPGAAGAGGL